MRSLEPRRRGRLKAICFLLLVSVLLLAACSRMQRVNEGVTPPVLPTATPMPTPTATATVEQTPTTTQLPPSDLPKPMVSVSDQALGDDGTLTVDRVISSESGWIVIHQDDEGDAGEILGYAGIDMGESQDVSVQLDPLQASQTLQAILYLDEGQQGVFESPGPDNPVQVDADIIADSFEVEVIVFVPELKVSDQEVGEDGLVTIGQVVLENPGWIALYLDERGEPGRMLGYSPVAEGETQDLVVSLNRFEATPILHALLFEDGGESGHFEGPEIDKPITAEGDPLTTSFEVILPPDIFILDQPVVNGEIMVERTISYGPGWVVIYNDDDGELGRIIGWSALEDGVNEQISVPIVESAVTPQMFVMLHQDLEEIGEFGFPATDPLVLYQDRLPNPFTFRIDSGNYLITRDQEISASDTVTIPLAVVDVNAWVVVRADDSGEPGEIAGKTSIPAGVNRDVVVEVDQELVTSTLYAVLHLDLGTASEFDFPDGLDIPLQRNRSIILAPFVVEQAGESP